jgi:hypothetical protein
MAQLKYGGLLRLGVEHAPPKSIEIFNLGIVGVESEEPFIIARPPIVLDFEEPFQIRGTAGAETAESCALGSRIWTDSTEDFAIIGATIGGYLGTSPASPQLGWRDRT